MFTINGFVFNIDGEVIGNGVTLQFDTINEALLALLDME